MSDKTDSRLELCASSKKRALQCSIVLGILLPIIIIEFFKSHYDKEFWLIFVMVTPCAVPLIYLLIFNYIKMNYKCKKCKASWVFKKINEIFLERYMNPLDEHDAKLILNEKFLNEMECQECGYQTLVPGERKIIAERENG